MTVGVVVLVVGAALLASALDRSGEDVLGESVPAADERVSDPEDAPRVSGDTRAPVSPLLVTNNAGEIIPPQPPASPAPEPTAPAGTASPGASAAPAPTADLTPEEQAYLDETKRVVESNGGALEAMASAVTESLGSRDAGGLSALMADDETDPAGYSAELAKRYPPISAFDLGSNVNVYAADETTLYFAFARVVWTDAGITSQHTIPLVFRYFDGGWRLSSLGDTATDLQFVQAVPLW